MRGRNTLVGAALLLVSVTGHAAPAFVRVEESTVGPIETCPIRVELPLPILEPGKPHRTIRAARVQCEGAYLPLVTVEQRKSAGARTPVHASVRYFWPHGTDQEFRIRYWLMEGDQVLAAGRELLVADEGDVNWEDGADLWYAGRDLHQRQLSLRIEVAPSDSPEVDLTSPAAACTADQILGMKALGLSDPQIKTACPE